MHCCSVVLRRLARLNTQAAPDSFNWTTLLECLGSTTAPPGMAVCPTGLALRIHPRPRHTNQCRLTDRLQTTSGLDGRSETAVVGRQIPINKLLVFQGITDRTRCSGYGDKKKQKHGKYHRSAPCGPRPSAEWHAKTACARQDYAPATPPGTLIRSRCQRRFPLSHFRRLKMSHLCWC